MSTVTSPEKVLYSVEQYLEVSHLLRRETSDNIAKKRRNIVVKIIPGQ
jgi:hypothetical protein